MHVLVVPLAGQGRISALARLCGLLSRPSVVPALGKLRDRIACNACSTRDPHRRTEWSSMARIGRRPLRQGEDRSDEQDPDRPADCDPFWIRFRSGPSDLYVVMEQGGNRV